MATEPPLEPAVSESETDAVRRRYAAREAGDYRYSLLNPAAMAAWQERQRAQAHLFVRLGWRDLAAKRLLEVGCGTGGNLLDFLRLGFEPENIHGIELLPERFAHARRVLSADTQLHLGDALAVDLAPESFDVVVAATVFSSLLDDAFQAQLAARMWSWVKPGGGVLWYDFTVNNPRNRDVRGVPVKRVQALFPQGRVQARRVTLAPPLARAAVPVHPALYTLLNCLPLLRTHVLAWVAKPESR